MYTASKVINVFDSRTIYDRSKHGTYAFIPVMKVNVGCFPIEAIELHVRLNASTLC